MLRQITDGFSLDTKLLPLLYQYRTSAISQMEILRRADSFQLQWIVIPQELAETVPAYGQIEYQALITPGSWIWGYSMKATYDNGQQIVNVPTAAHFRLEDEGTGQYWSNTFEVGSALGLNGRAADEFGQMPIPMVQPFPVTPPGSVNVCIANELAYELSVQLVLSVARICRGTFSSDQECLP